MKYKVDRASVMFSISQPSIYVIEIPKGEESLNGVRNISGNIEWKIWKFYQNRATHMCYKLSKTKTGLIYKNTTSLEKHWNLEQWITV